MSQQDGVLVVKEMFLEEEVFSPNLTQATFIVSMDYVLYVFVYVYVHVYVYMCMCV